MHKVVLVINLQEDFASILNSKSWPENFGLRIIPFVEEDILIDAYEHDRNGNHSNPSERIFDVNLSSSKGKITIIFGDENKYIKKDINICEETTITVDFPEI